MTSLISIASSPKCNIVVYNQNGYFKNDEDVKGYVTINTPVEGQNLQHDGIKISLIGLIGKLFIIYQSIENKRSGIFGSSDTYAFLQLTRELECFGNFQTNIQREF